MKKFSLLIASALAASSLMAAAPMKSSSSAGRWGIVLAHSNSINHGSGSGNHYGFNYDTGAYSLKLGTNAQRVKNSSDQWFNLGNLFGSVDKRYRLSGNSEQTFGLSGAVEAQAPSTVNLNNGYNPYNLSFNYGINTYFSSDQVRYEFKIGLLTYTDSGTSNSEKRWALLGNVFNIQVTRFL